MALGRHYPLECSTMGGGKLLVEICYPRYTVARRFFRRLQRIEIDEATRNPPPRFEEPGEGTTPPNPTPLEAGGGAVQSPASAAAGQVDHGQTAPTPKPKLRTPEEQAVGHQILHTESEAFDEEMEALCHDILRETKARLPGREPDFDEVLDAIESARAVHFFVMEAISTLMMPAEKKRS